MKMSDENEDILVLDVEDTLIKCTREDLIKHSDYFKAMLEGNFSERDQKQIKIEGVSSRAINIILVLLWDETHLISEKDTLIVLQAACMLQFDKVKSICLERINEMLRLDNCIRIWNITEQLSLKPIYLKAKLMALQEFAEVCNSDSLLELTLDQLLDYLGNIYLNCHSELTVLQTGMKWWYEHSEHFSDESTNIFLKLLSCVDFGSLDFNSFNEILIYPDINDDKFLMEILITLRKLKKNDPLDAVSDIVKQKAELLYKAKSRIIPCYTAILVNTLPLSGCKQNEIGPQLELFYYDKFKRKRVLQSLISSRPEYLTAVFYDKTINKFKRLFAIDQNKCENLEGFKILGYKELVFLFGGQHLIGKGEWNINFWVYDSIRERWERKSRVPHCRRHFESCIVGNKVFIAGGVGNYRIIKDNTFFYDYKMDLWSNVVRALMPQMKCCSFLNKCFFFSTVPKCGYFWEENSLTQDLIRVDISVDEEILKKQSEYAIFSYNDKLYVKGKDLLEFEMENNKIILKSIFPVTDLDCDKMELIVCNNTVYTFYKYKNEEGATNYSLESYNLQTREINFVFKDLSENDQIGESENEAFLINSKLKIFTITHYNLVEENTVINDSFRNITNK